MTQLDEAFLARLTEIAGPVGKTLGMAIRPAFIADAGKTLVWGDWSAIEARVCPWLAASPGAEEKLEIFRKSDRDPNKPDVYVAGAAGFVGRDPQELWDAYRNGDPVAKKLRQSHGKVPELSLTFGGAFGALMKMAVNYHVYVDEEQAKAMVAGWRERNQWALDFWGKFRTDKTGDIVQSSGLWGAANMAMRNPGTAYTAGRVAYFFDKNYMSGTLICALPDTRLLTYPSCRWREREVKDKLTGEKEIKAAIWYQKGYGWSSLWHGKCAENITQAVAGSALRETLVQLDPEFTTLDDRLIVDGLMPVIGHTHDEAVTEVAPSIAEEAKALLKRVMETPTEWRQTLPLVSEVTENWFYSKATD